MPRKKQLEIKRDISLKELINQKISNNGIEEDTVKKINQLGPNSDKKEIMQIIETVKNDRLLKKNNRILIVESIYTQYIDIFNLDNCPDNYEDIRKEVVFFSGMIQYNFLLLANRLKKIRDHKLYEDNGYNSFKDFIENELSITKQTVYKYIDIYQFFGVSLKRLDRSVEYTKLHPIIPLLKSENQDIPKEEIRRHFIADLKTKTQKEFVEEAKKLKLKYGLIKNKTEETETQKIKKNIINKLKDKKELSTQARKDIKEIIDYLKEKLEQCILVEK